MHLVLIDVIMYDAQQVARDGQSIVQHLYPWADLEVVSNSLVQRQERGFRPEELGCIWKAVSARNYFSLGIHSPRIPLLKLTSILSLNNRPVIFNASRLLSCSSPVVASSLGNEAVDERESCMTLS